VGKKRGREGGRRGKREKERERERNRVMEKNESLKGERWKIEKMR